MMSLFTEGVNSKGASPRGFSKGHRALWVYIYKNMPECLLDVCDINHSGVEDYTIFSNISGEYHVKEVDKAKRINSNINSEFYCSQYNYWRQHYCPAVQATVKEDNWRRRVSSAFWSLNAPPVYKRRSQTHAFDTTNRRRRTTNQTKNSERIHHHST